MIIAFSAGRKGSKGLPSKNLYMIDSYYLMEYPLMAAKDCSLIDQVYFSSDCDIQMKIAGKYGATLFDRPKELAADNALLEDVYIWMWNKVKKNDIEFVVIFMSNAPCITSKIIEEMIFKMRENKKADSICTISKYNMYHPNRSRKFEVGSQYLIPYVPECITDWTTCDRNSGGDNYIYDCSCAVIRPRCLEEVHLGTPPQKWLGNKIMGYDKYNDVPRVDIDFSWQIGQIECWLDKYGK